MTQSSPYCFFRELKQPLPDGADIKIAVCSGETEDALSALDQMQINPIRIEGRWQGKSSGELAATEYGTFWIEQIYSKTSNDSDGSSITRLKIAMGIDDKMLSDAEYIQLLDDVLIAGDNCLNSQNKKTACELSLNAIADGYTGAMSISDLYFLGESGVLAYLAQ